jgi:hypothetical protein
MSVATKISDNCIVFGGETYIQSQYEVITAKDNKQIRYYSPYLMSSTVQSVEGPKLHLQELGASFVAVMEFEKDLCLDDLKTAAAQLMEWVSHSTPFRPNFHHSIYFVKQSTLYVPVSTSYYWE